MGWFSDQIKERIESDDESFSLAFDRMANIVMPKRVSSLLNDRFEESKNAIKEIFKYYHIKVEVSEDVKDINEELELHLHSHGFMKRVVNLEGTWYKDSIGPLLGSIKGQNIPTPLIPGTLGGYKFYDNDKKRWVGVNKENAKEIDREAYCFYKPFPNKKINLKELIIYMVQTITPLDIIMLLSSFLFAFLVGLLLPRINLLIYGNVINSTSISLLLSCFGFLLCVSLSQMFISIIKDMSQARILCKLNLNLQAAGMMRVLSLPAGFFKDYSSGELSSYLGYLTTLTSLITNTVLTTGLSSVFSLAYITQMAYYAPSLVIPGLAVILLTLLFTLLVTFMQLKISKKQMILDAKEGGLEYSLITGVQKIRLSGAEKRAFAKWANAYTKNASLEYNPPFIIKISSVISSFISLFGTIVIYYYTIKSGVSLANYYAFISSYGMVSGAFISLVGVATTFARIKPMFDVISPLLESETEIDDKKKSVKRLSGSIELNNLYFRYTQNGPNIIDELSLKIRHGEYVAITGETGCGKSTLVRLLLGFETPQKGAIYYDGKDITSLELKSLRQNIGTVLQNGKLFQGDIYSNIVITKPELSLDDAWRAAEVAGLSDDIKALPMGMHTIISEGGGGLSGGQKQRLMIARAIAPKPKILIFDEATSALDNITQRRVSDSLKSLKCTRIVIAHRLSTIKECDRIILLKDGKIAEDGKYDELIERDGIFSELVKRQLVDK